MTSPGPPVAVVPRLLGIAGLVWLVTMRWGLQEWPSQAVWALYVSAWLAASVALTSGRAVRPAAGAIAVLAVVGWLGPVSNLVDGLALFGWFGLILAVTGRDDERALLLRVQVSVVYGFAAIAKLNPTFLDGDQLRGIFRSRGRWEAPVELLEGGTGTAVALGALAIEVFLAVALWFPRTRRVAVVVGVVAHVAFIVVASHGPLHDTAFLLVLNGLLVAAYPAFFSPLPRREEGAPVVGHDGARTTEST